MRWNYKVILLTLLLVAFIFYYVGSFFFFYSNDGYITSDLIKITAQEKGPINKIYIVNNQWVRRGTLLFTIVQRPYVIAVQQQQALLEQAKQNLLLLQFEQAEARAALQAEQAKLNLYNLTLKRYEALLHTKTIPRQQFDNIIAEQHVANADVLKAQALLQSINANLAVQVTKINKAVADYQYANYQLSLTNIYAPLAGYINNLNVYPGDYLTAGQPVFGLVSSNNWRIIANYKESAVGRIQPGNIVLIYLASQPLRFFQGEVVSVGRAVAREQNAGNAALPYIQPTTDWIRYPYRFPVLIKFKHLPSDIQLYMGSDVKTLIIE